MALYRFQTVFTGVAGSPAYNSVYLNTTVDPDLDAAALALKALWHGLLVASDDQCIATFDGDVQEINPVTGQIVATQSADPWTDGGQNTGALLPPATQGLLRIRTGAYEAGRQLQGRIYIPYLTVGAGNAVPSGPQVVLWTNAGNNFDAAVLGAGFEWVVWSKTHGLFHTVSSVSAWNQFAVQRSRRD